MGMPAVQGTIQQHKGDIDIHSELNRGTTINLYLPSSDRLQDSGLLVNPCHR